jgi:hypothetical protein
MGTSNLIVFLQPTKDDFEGEEKERRERKNERKKEREGKEREGGKGRKGKREADMITNGTEPDPFLEQG